MITLFGHAGAHADRLNSSSIEKLMQSTLTGEWARTLNSGFLQLLMQGGRVHSEDTWTVAVCGDIRWRSGSNDNPLSALIAGFRRDGVKTLDNVLGHFLIVVANSANRDVWVAVDRTGVQRIFYQLADGDLRFATHLKPLVKAADARPKICEQAIYNYLYFHMIPSPHTIYRDYFKLEPGHVLHWHNGAIKTHNFCHPKFRAKNESSVTGAKHRLLPTLESAVKRAAANKSTGAFLSGGLDSSTVAGLLAKVSDKAPPTFNIAFDEERYDESPWARLTAQHFHTRHHEYRLQPDEALAALPTIAQSFDEPFGNSSALPVYFCAKVAREQGVKCLLAGDGGDELFAGNTRYAKQKLFEPYTQLPAGLKSFTESAFGIHRAARWPGPLGKVQSYIRQANVPLPDRLQSYNFLHLNKPEQVFTTDVLNGCDQEYPLQIWRERYQQAKAASPIDAMLYLDWKFTLADNDLVKVNRMCELAGMEVAYPMLDDDMLDLCAQVSAQDKLPGQKLRAFYKDAVKGFLPDATLNKSKHGFGLPFGMWLKEHAGLRQIVSEQLNNLKQRNYLNPQFIDQAKAQHEQGHASFYGELVWLMLVLELWLEHNG